MKGIPKDKSLGVDGYPIEVFQKHYKIVKVEVCSIVYQFFSIGKMMKTWNCIAITLIPKFPSPIKLKNFRPITCCSTV